MNRTRNRITTFFLFSMALTAAMGMINPASARAGTPTVNGLGAQDALLVVDPSGQTVISHNPDKPMVPASTLKVLTSLAALHYLSPDYRFTTDFTLDSRRNLVIKGYGDPLLVSEVIAAIARQLAGKLPPEINDILLDDSYFKGPLTIPGVSTSTNPYDAPIGALCANFNTVFFTHVNGRPRSAEEQTPLLPMILTAHPAIGIEKWPDRPIPSPERSAALRRESVPLFPETGGCCGPWRGAHDVRPTDGGPRHLSPSIPL